MTSSTRETVDTECYDVWERAFSDDSDIDPEMLLDPVSNREAALKAHRKAHKYDANPEYKERIAEKLRQFSE